MMEFAVVSMLFVLGVVLGCMEAPLGRSERVSDTGTVVFISLEGGFYGITDEHGRDWDPSNLPEAFKVDGLDVTP